MGETEELKLNYLRDIKESIDNLDSGIKELIGSGNATTELLREVIGLLTEIRNK